MCWREVGLIYRCVLYVHIVFFASAGLLVCDTERLSGSYRRRRRRHVTLGRQLRSKTHFEENATQRNNENSCRRLPGITVLVNCSYKSRLVSRATKLTTLEAMFSYRENHRIDNLWIIHKPFSLRETHLKILEIFDDSKKCKPVMFLRHSIIGSNSNLFKFSCSLCNACKTSSPETHNWDLILKYN